MAATQWLSDFVAVLALSAATATLAHAQGVDRSDNWQVWTLIGGREMSAKVLNVADEHVVFLLENGKRARLPTLQLAEADRARIDDLRSTGNYWNAVSPPRSWPKIVTLPEPNSNKIKVISEDAQAGRYVYRTAHYQIEVDAQLAPHVVDAFAQIFELTHAAMLRNPLGLRTCTPDSGYHQIRVFKDIVGYHRAGGVARAAGVYSTKSKQILIPFQSLGLRKTSDRWVQSAQALQTRTLIHEATHQLLSHWLKVAPAWFSEGFADLLGCARFDGRQLVLDDLQSGLPSYLSRQRASQPSVTATPEVALDLPGILLASHAQFMGFSPAKPLTHQQLQNHYHSSVVLVHFMIHQSQGSRQALRDYLEAYRHAVSRQQLHLLEFPERIHTVDDRERLKRMMAKKTSIESRAAKSCHAILTGGRSLQAFFDDLKKFYRTSAVVVVDVTDQD